MLPTDFLKKYFPNAPDWILGGLLLVFILWLMVLPVEISQILLRQDFVRSWGWIVRPLYVEGLQTSMSLIPSRFGSPITKEIIYVLLGLLISSPAYFVIGALLATRKAITLALGILLLTAKIGLGCYSAMSILFSFG